MLQPMVKLIFRAKTRREFLGRVLQQRLWAKLSGRKCRYGLDVAAKIGYGIR